MDIENELPPPDDSGINNDYILDLCDFIVNTAWAKYIGNADSSDVPISELKQLSSTLQNVWILVQNILEIDQELRSQAEGEGNQDDQQGPG